MNDRNGVEVRAGDRVMVFSADKLYEYGKIVAIGAFGRSRLACHTSARVELFSPARQVLPLLDSYNLELPVAAAVARSCEP